jgi:ribose transport system permease protein
VAAKLSGTIGIPAAMAAAVLVGTLAGVVNGLLVTVGRINSFLATLASQTIINGLAVLLTGGFVITVAGSSFSHLGTGSLAGVVYPIWIAAVVAIVLGFLLARTVLGRCVYAIGISEEVSRLSGIRIGPIRTTTFAISGATAALAGIIAASTISQGQAGTGTGLELSAIAVVAIGGTSILGGEGAVWRTIIGVVLLTLISNGFDLLGLSTVYQNIAEGGLIIVAVAGDAWARRRRTRPTSPQGAPRVASET